MQLIDHQQRAALEAAEAQPRGSIATVAAVHPDGISLILPGDTAPSEKHYAYNGAVTFAPGQRVHIVRESGTIIVEYPIKGGSA